MIAVFPAARTRLRDDRGARIAIDVRPVAPRMFRVHIGPEVARPSRLLVADAPSAADWSMEADADGWSIQTIDATLRIDRDHYRGALSDQAGRARVSEERHDQDIRGGYHHVPSGHARGLRWLTAALTPDEALFGLGEHFGALDRRGQAFASWTVDAFGVRRDRA